MMAVKGDDRQQAVDRDAKVDDDVDPSVVVGRDSDLRGVPQEFLLLASARDAFSHSLGGLQTLPARPSSAA